MEVGTPAHPIHRIWPDFDVFALLDKSVSTVKADALQAAFAGYGKDICWAVLDTGIDANHPHFAAYKNVLSSPVPHRDFTGRGGEITDNNGHGTHVAGIIAGSDKAPEGGTLSAVRFERDEQGKVKQQFVPLPQISGMAPQCSIVSYKVLDDSGSGRPADILTALEAIQEVNDNGRRLKIHGVNLSLGYDFDPKWFACGQSPLCVEVDRLVRSGVVVVVAAGNTGTATAPTRRACKPSRPAGHSRSTTRATPSWPITVGVDAPGHAAHLRRVVLLVQGTDRRRPGASPTWSRPGERITVARPPGKTRAAAGAAGQPATPSITSRTAAPAWPRRTCPARSRRSCRSGSEFIGQPDEVKQIFTSTATDLGRVRYFQGHGLVDLMRAIQSV